VVVRDMQQTQELAKYILGEKPAEQFYSEFNNQFSKNFDVTNHLERIGVVNQTTMLASDTQAISDFLKETMIRKYNLIEENVKDHFADTRDTLCYATNDNQTAVSEMLQTDADLAIVVGGYNSSNTSHLVELCEEKLPTYYISGDDKILSEKTILHFDFHSGTELLTENYLPLEKNTSVLVTSGASCPDALVEGIIKKLISFYPTAKSIDQLAAEFN
jgi:4-hydroxy-3-methylbut-2-enyl diphosphate reductase